MIRHRAGQELDPLARERAGHAAVIPACIKANLAEGKARRERRRGVIQHGLETGASRRLGGFANPLVANGVAAVAEATRIEVGAPPKPVALGDERFVHEAARDGGGRAVEARDEQDAIGGMQRGGISRGVVAVRQRAGELVAAKGQREQGEFAVHRGFVAAQLGRELVGVGFGERGVADDFQRHAEAEDGVTDLRLGDGGRVGRIELARGSISAEFPEAALGQRFQQRLLQQLAELLARHRLARRQRQADDLVRRHAARSEVVRGDGLGVFDGAVVEDDGGIAQAGRDGNQRGKTGDGEQRLHFTP